MAKEKRPIRQWPVLTVCTLMAFFGAGAVFAQSPEDIQDFIEVELIVPQSIVAGESFTVYARVQNLSERALDYPSIVRDSSTASAATAGYSYNPCGVPCLLVGAIAPGETVYLGAGTYYYTDEVLAAGELQVDDYTVQYLDRDEPEVRYLPVVPVMSVTVARTEDPDALNPAFVIPAREPLQIRDLLSDGDALLIHDPNTGRDWVRFATSRDLVPEGFSLARTSQVEELLLNHLHAAGHQVQLYDLYPNTPRRLDAPLATFVRLMQPVFESENSLMLSGTVADRTGFSMGANWFGVLDLFVRLEGNSPQCGCNNSSGLRRTTGSPRVGDTSQDSYRSWLVRSPDPLPARPSDKPSFYDNELVVPELLVDGVHYRGTLTLIDPALGLYRLSGLDEVAASGDNLEFDAETGHVQLPEVVVIEDDGGTARVSAILEILENTTPPIFQLIDMQPL